MTIFNLTRTAFSLGAITLGSIGVPAIAVAADLNTGTDTQLIEPQFDPVASSSIWSGAYGGLYGGLNWKSVGVRGSGDVD